MLILTDNQGAWTLGCYGNPDIRTPHIDRLAREGMLFERCYSSNAVCSPTRATLLTGLIPSQHGVHSYLTAGGAQMGPRCVFDHRRVSHVARDSGRSGLRVRLERQVALGRQPDSRRRDSRYWVTMPHGHTRTFYDADVIEDGKVRKEPEYLTDFWTDHGVKFIEREQGQAVLFVPGVQRAVWLGREHARTAPATATPNTTRTRS